MSNIWYHINFLFQFQDFEIKFWDTYKSVKINYFCLHILVYLWVLCLHVLTMCQSFFANFYMIILQNIWILALVFAAKFVKAFMKKDTYKPLVSLKKMFWYDHQRHIPLWLIKQENFLPVLHTEVVLLYNDTVRIVYDKVLAMCETNRRTKVVIGYVNGGIEKEARFWLL